MTQQPNGRGGLRFVPEERLHRRDRCDMAVGQRALDDDGLLAGRQHGAALDERSQAFDEPARPVAEIEQGALLDLVADAVGSLLA